MRRLPSLKVFSIFASSASGGNQKCASSAARAMTHSVGWHCRIKTKTMPRQSFVTRGCKSRGSIPVFSGARWHSIGELSSAPLLIGSSAKDGTWILPCLRVVVRVEKREKAGRVRESHRVEIGAGACGPRASGHQFRSARDCGFQGLAEGGGGESGRNFVRRLTSAAYCNDGGGPTTPVGRSRALRRRRVGA